jgi:hypothetical protein
MFAASAKTEVANISYARSRLMGLYSFFGISTKDAALLWSALDLIDKQKQECVHIKDFAATFCPNSRDLFEKMFDKYCFAPKVRAFKTSVSVSGPSPADDSSLGMDADEMMAYLAKSETEQKAAKAKFDEELRVRREKEKHERHRPDYVRFLCFFLFFMSRPDDEIPLWVYWLWYALPKVKPDKENIHDLVNQLWSAANFNKSWYDGEVRYIVKVIDPSFNARTFQLTDQRCGGAWSIPFHEMRSEIYLNFERKGYFDRVASGFEYSMQNLDLCMRRMKDLRLKGAPTDHTHSGDRGDARHDIRTFVNHFKTFKNMPMDAEETFAEGSCLKSIGIVLNAKFKALTGPCRKCWKKIIPEDIDMSMGMGSEGYVRPSSRGTLAKLKKQMNKGGPSGKSDKTAQSQSPTDELKNADEEAEAEKKRLVPLEYKYRKQLELPPRVLNHKAVQMRAEGRQLLNRCVNEVIDAKAILSAFNLGEYSTDINIDPIDDLESLPDEMSENNINPVDDEESTTN